MYGLNADRMHKEASVTSGLIVQTNTSNSLCPYCHTYHELVYTHTRTPTHAIYIHSQMHTQLRHHEIQVNRFALQSIWLYVQNVGYYTVLGIQ